MQFSYNDGQFIEGDFCVSGQIILSENKLFLKDSHGDITRTYLPLDKIDRLKLQGTVMLISIKASMSFQFNVKIKGEKKSIIELVHDIAKRRGMKKLFLRNEWVDESI